MESHPIWNLPCTIIDVILAICYEHAELLKMFPDLEIDFMKCQSSCGFPISADHLIYGMVHQGCRSESPIAQKIQLDLDRRFVEALETVRRASPPAVLEMAAACLEDASQLPGVLWAVMRDPRPVLCRYKSLVVQGVVLRSVRNWMEKFGPPIWTEEL